MALKVCHGRERDAIARDFAVSKGEGGEQVAGSHGRAKVAALARRSIRPFFVVLQSHLGFLPENPWSDIQRPIHSLHALHGCDRSIIHKNTDCDGDLCVAGRASRSSGPHNARRGVPILREARMNLHVSASSASRRVLDERFIADDFLSVEGRVVRSELAAWTASLAAAVSKAISRREGRLAAFSVCFREAIALALELGKTDEARQIAMAAVRLFSHAITRERRPEAVGFAVASLAWLGCVERSAGNVDEALLHLGRARSLGQGAELAAGILRVTRAQWDSLVALDRTKAQWASYWAATEMLSTLLVANRLEDVLSLALVSRRGAADPPALEWVRREAALSALCRLGRPDEALSLAARYTIEAGEGERLAFEMRRAEVLACFGDIARAYALAESVASQLDRKWRGRPATLAEVQMAVAATRLCKMAGEPLGVDFCWTTLAESLAIGDVPLEAELLGYIVETDWDIERREDASELLRALAFGSGYRLPAARALLVSDEGPLSSQGPLSVRSVEERAPGFAALVECLCSLESKRW